MYPIISVLALKRLTWKDVYDIVLPYRRLADLETPILWLSMIYKEEHIGYHNEVSFYRFVNITFREAYYEQLVYLSPLCLNTGISFHPQTK